MKKCTTCKEEKAFNEYRNRKSASDNLTSSCKACLRKYDKSYHKKNRKERNLKSAEYSALRRIKDPDLVKKIEKKSRLKRREKLRLISSEYRMKNKEKIKETRNSYNAKFPLKKECIRILKNLRRRKDFVRPVRCEVCSAKGCRIEGHHSDYLKPYDISWLCVPCHNNWHTVNGQGMNGELHPENLNWDGFEFSLKEVKY
tara:strand:- start:16855 stop:17454 length:600 start_codon:yes stop_codon:yes gene_type:complete